MIGITDEDSVILNPSSCIIVQQETIKKKISGKLNATDMW